MGPDDVDVAGDDVDDGDLSMILMMMMVVWRLTENVTTPLNTNCGYQNWAPYCCCDLSLTRTERCCYGNSLRCPWDWLILLNLLNLKDIFSYLHLLHSKWLKLHRVLVILSAIGLRIWTPTLFL